jgi:hypothetical protein
MNGVGTKDKFNTLSKTIYSVIWGCHGGVDVEDSQKTRRLTLISHTVFTYD